MHDDIESPFILHSRSEIVEKLRQIERARSVIRVFVGKDGRNFYSAVVKVLPEKGLVALDVSDNSVLNQLVLADRKMSCEAHVYGVETRFSLTGIQPAVLDGTDLFAAEIPQTLFWLQRRNFYRVAVPASRFMKCRITLPSSEAVDYQVLNLSLIGLAVLDTTGQLSHWGREGQILGPCVLRATGLEADQFALEVRNRLETSRLNDFRNTMRIGLAFRDMGQDLETKLQKLIFELERESRRENDA